MCTLKYTLDVLFRGGRGWATRALLFWAKFYRPKGFWQNVFLVSYFVRSIALRRGEIVFQLSVPKEGGGSLEGALLA